MKAIIRASGVREIVGRGVLSPDWIVSTCGHCDRSWDDSYISAWTPAPAARCPFEYEHKYEDEEA